MELDFTLRPDENLPLSAYRRLRRAGPVVWSDALGGWLVSSYDAVREVLSDVARFTSAGTPVAEILGAEGMLVNDTPLHHQLRAVWAKHVSPAAMARRENELKACADEVLAAVRPRLDAGERVDFVPLFRAFVMAFVATSFDIPRSEVAVFERWSQLSANTPAVGMAEGSEEQQRHFAVRQDVFDLVHEQMADRKVRLDKGEKPQDFIALMVAAIGQGGITPSIAADNLFNFVLGAFDTTERWLGNIVTRLYSDGALFAEVAGNLDLIARFNEEVMRCDCVVQTIQRRVAHGGADLAGHAMKAGDPVFLLLGAANRDPAKFADADRFDMHRPALPHFGFGVGFHHCLGVHIVRLEALVFTRALLEGFPDLRIARFDYGDSWALWGPRTIELQRRV